MIPPKDLAPDMENDKPPLGVSTGGVSVSVGSGGESGATTTVKGRRVKDHRYTQHVSSVFILL